MFDVLDFVQEIGLTVFSPVSSEQSNNQQKLADIAAYRNLTHNWDEDGAVAPDHQTIVVVLDITLLLIAQGQTIYHTSPGPVGEIMFNLRSGSKSVEFLIYSNDQRKVVRLGENETPWQGPLTPETLGETLHWLNQ